jgi:streptogramin lyase
VGDLLLTWGDQGSGAQLLRQPLAVAVDNRDQVYLLDQDIVQIKIFGGDGRFLRSWKMPDLLSQPSSIAVDRTGNVFVADALNQKVVKFGSDGTLLTSWGSHGPESGQFQVPNGIAMGRNNYLYVSDMSDYRVQKFCGGE